MPLDTASEPCTRQVPWQSTTRPPALALDPAALVLAVVGGERVGFARAAGHGAAVSSVGLGHHEAAVAEQRRDAAGLYVGVRGRTYVVEHSEEGRACGGLPRDRRRRRGGPACCACACACATT